jgi:muramoyltetrapeptide carboxypeptidase
VEQAVIKPRPLHPGDTIGVAAPASPFNRADLERGVASLESMGYQVRIPENLFVRNGYLAGSDRDRAALLMELFSDDSIAAVFCARGGFGSMKLLPLLDFEAMGRHPKIFLGYSDITTLVVSLYQKCRMVTFHGPHVTTLKRPCLETDSALINAVGSGDALAFRPSGPVVLNAGKACGPVLGGNLTNLAHLTGTPFAPSFNEHLLFLEDRGEAPYRIDRMLSHLSLGGLLEGVSGVILGSFQDCGSIEDVYRIVKEAFRGTDIPILAGFDFGHGTPNLTLPIGLEAELDTEEGCLRFLEAATS